jgi:hypothetical protein
LAAGVPGLTELAAALQDTAIATALRQSFWVYPLVNAAHIVGLALLFGAIVPLDLRLLGLWRKVPLAAMSRILLPVALAGLVLAVPTGALLFAVRATEYAVMPLFWLKFSLIAGAIANALLLRFSLAWTAHEHSELAGTMPRLQVAGALSIGLWLAVIVAGRMIGYL